VDDILSHRGAQKNSQVFSRALSDSKTRYVDRLVGLSVRPSPLAFFAFSVFALLLLPKCSSKPFFSSPPCPLTRDFGSRVNDLVLELTDQSIGEIKRSFFFKNCCKLLSVAHYINAKC